MVSALVQKAVCPWRGAVAPPNEPPSAGHDSLTVRALLVLAMVEVLRNAFACGRCHLENEVHDSELLVITYLVLGLCRNEAMRIVLVEYGLQALL